MLINMLAKNICGFWLLSWLQVAEVGASRLHEIREITIPYLLQLSVLIL